MRGPELIVGGTSVRTGTAYENEVGGVFRTVRPGYVEWDKQGHVKPYGHVRRSSVFASVCAHLNDPEWLVGALQQPRPHRGAHRTEKLIAEAAFEDERASFFPGLPSRLDCVFAFASRHEAAAFSGHGQVVELVANGPWAIFDLRNFTMIEEMARDPGGVIEDLTRLRAQARLYWSGATREDFPSPLFEVLAASANLRRAPG